MYGDGHKNGPSTGVWDETTNANRPLPAKKVYGGWIKTMNLVFIIPMDDCRMANTLGL